MPITSGIPRFALPDPSTPSFNSFVIIVVVLLIDVSISVWFPASSLPDSVVVE
jgi:hypothetical protein